MQNTCIIIAGPTAVGKTSLAIQLALALKTEIISADSRQCYQELNIAVAKPTPQELALVPHYFINSHSIQQEVSAADFENYALEKAAAIFKNNNIAVMVGGTGLYIKAFAEGLDAIPTIEEAIRQEISTAYALQGIDWLRETLRQEDFEYYERGEIANPQRMMRALEVKRSTGSSITTFQTRRKKARPFRMVKIGLELPRSTLYDRINARVDAMVAAGLEDEARRLLPHRHLNALQTVGYRELFRHFDGELSKDAAIDLLKQHTRHYAKRQLTWFKRDEEMHWLSAQDPALLSILLNIVKEK